MNHSKRELKAIGPENQTLSMFVGEFGPMVAGTKWLKKDMQER
jgi:hypothetical protein